MATCHKCGKRKLRKRRCPHCGPLPVSATEKTTGNISSAYVSIYMAAKVGGELTPASRRQLGAIKTWATAMLNGDVPDVTIIAKERAA